MNDHPTQDTPKPPAPMKKACMISLMFEVENDDEAFDVKRKLDDALPNIDKKRYTFQIVET